MASFAIFTALNSRKSKGQLNLPVILTKEAILLVLSSLPLSRRKKAAGFHIKISPVMKAGKAKKKREDYNLDEIVHSKKIVPKKENFGF